MGARVLYAGMPYQLAFHLPPANSSCTVVVVSMASE